MQELERRVQILTTENKNLMKKVENQNTRKNSLVIEKIKEQYEEKISTMKMMVEQEIRDAIGIIEDTCLALTNQMKKLSNKVEELEMKIHETKVRTILMMDR